jgi:DNA polymerase delta subunit 1
MFTTLTLCFYQVYVAMPSLVPGLKRLFDDGVSISGVGTSRCLTYESNVPFILRYMIDNNISGADWIELPANKYSIRSQASKTTRCSIEADIFFNEVVTHPSVGVWSTIAPFRILSFDIECQGR